MKIFGIAEKAFDELISLFSQKQNIEKVVLFGSRAMGAYTEGSDIDLALFGNNLKLKDQLKLSGLLEQLGYPYAYDFQIHNNIKDQDVLEHIVRVGIVIYQKLLNNKSEWEDKRLGYSIKIKHGFAFKGKFINDQPNDNILVTPGNFNIGGGFKQDKCKYYFGDIPSEYVLKGGDIVVTMTDLSKDSDTLGYSAKIPKSNGVKYLHNQRIGLVQFTSDEINHDFIYWLMRTREYQGYIVGSASGTSIMHTSPTRIEDYEYLLPPLPEQKAIASVLSSLDDKIDLLHRQNKTLASMAETLFRLWFVERRPELVEGEAVDGWEIGKLGDILETIQSGSRPKGGIDPELKDGIPSIGAENINGLGYYNFSKTKFVTKEFFDKMKRGLIDDNR